MIPDRVTIGAKYGPAMGVKTKSEAKTKFAELVEHAMHVDLNLTRETAVAQERNNLGYYAGYYDRETQERVQALYGAPHPLFGPVR